MYGWMQANQKKMMAIFGVVLMIAFILPTTITSSFGNPDPVRGYIGDQPVTDSEVRMAAEQWDLLTELAVQFGLFEPSFQFMLQVPQVMEGYKENPEAFLLLQREAQRMNVGYSSDALNSLLSFLPPNARDLRHAEFRRNALINLLLVNNSFERAVSALKFSEPRVRREVAENLQTVRVNLVEFDATHFLQDIPTPTPEQVEQQIERYGNIDPDNIDPATNPHGFSYRVPNRVKLQYIQVPIAEVRRKVETSRSEFEWRSQAARYYQQHPEQFPATQPAQQESILDNVGDGLTLGGSGQRPAATQPTTRPFNEVYEQIRQTLMRPEIDRQIKQIHDRVAVLMQKGYERHQAIAAGRDAPRVASTVTADYDSHEFLQQVAQLIQRETGILPTVVTLDDTWRDLDAVNRLPGLGTAVLPDQSPQALQGFSMEQPVARVLFDRAEPFRSEADRNNPETLSVLEPSPVFRDGRGDAYIVRLTAAVAAHAPSSPEERREMTGRAVQDLRLLAAYEKAKEAAGELYRQAEREGRLESAASAADRRVITTGPISRFSPFVGQSITIEGYAVRPESEEAFADQVFALLRQTGEQRHPVTMIELPRENRVLVAELNRVEPTPFFMEDVDALGSDLARMKAARELAQDWFDVEAIRQRMNWRPRQ